MASRAFSDKWFYAIDFGDKPSENHLHVFPTGVRRDCFVMCDKRHRAACTYEQALIARDYCKLYRSADLQVEV